MAKRRAKRAKGAGARFEPSRYSAVWIALALAAGIALAEAVGSGSVRIASGLLCGAALLLCAPLWLGLPRRNGLVHLAGICLAAGALGLLRAWWAAPTVEGRHLAAIASVNPNMRIEEVALVATQAAAPSAHGATCKGEVFAYRTQQGWQRATGRIRVFCKDANVEAMPLPGDTLYATAAPHPHPPTPLSLRRGGGGLSAPQAWRGGLLASPENLVSPIRPNYGSIFARQGWHLSVFCKGGEWRVRRNCGWSLHKAAARCAYALEGALAKAFADPKRAASAQALLLGRISALDDAVVSAYATAGALHVLAVSGAHLLFLFGAVSFLLKYAPLRMQGPGRLWLRLASLGLVWMFALITGLGPAVLRAALGITIFELATWSERTVRPMQVLGLVGCIMLLIDPGALYVLGVQFSFTAVAGLLIIQPAIARPWRPKYKLLRWGWEAFTATLAAQAATVPVALAHFGWLPVYFLPTNMAAAILSLAGLGGSALVALVGWLGIYMHPLLQVARWLALPTGFVLQSMDAVMAWAATMPYNQWRVPPIGLGQALVLWAALGWIVAANQLHPKTWRVAGLLLAALWAGLYLQSLVRRNQANAVWLGVTGDAFYLAREAGGRLCMPVFADVKALELARLRGQGLVVVEGMVDTAAIALVLPDGEVRWCGIADLENELVDGEVAAVVPHPKGGVGLMRRARYVARRYGVGVYDIGRLDFVKVGR